MIKKYHIHTEFPDDCLLEAQHLKENTDFNNFKNRRDFTQLITLTIDPESARDFDDALSLEELNDGSINV